VVSPLAIPRANGRKAYEHLRRATNGRRQHRLAGKRTLRDVLDLVRNRERSLAHPFQIGAVEVPCRVVLAPMAGVSVQAFRRQGRRFGAGLVCSEMVSACGLSYGNERTLGYLRIAGDEHPMAVQVFGSEPDLVAKAAAMSEAAGADLIDINMGCPVRKVTKTGAGGSLLEQPELAARIVEAVASAVDVPVTVKLRRGLRNGSRSALDLGPRLVEAGASALTLHPRSAQQMYTGEADHGLTRELVERVDVPVIASGDITTRERARAVLEETGAAAVMIGRGAQGNPWLLRELAGGEAAEPTSVEVVAELIRFVHEVARELGEERSVGFLRKFYGWYLHGGRLPRHVRAELAQAPTIADVESTLLREQPAAEELLAAHARELDELGHVDDDALLELPISIYGGG
jgi:tRNA-dihydrouridine synthase B